MNFVGLGFAFEAQDKDVVKTIETIGSGLERLNDRLGGVSKAANDTSLSLRGLGVGAHALQTLSSSAENTSRTFDNLGKTGTQMRGVLRDAFDGAGQGANRFQGVLQNVADSIEKFGADAVQSVRSEMDARTQLATGAALAMAALKKQAADPRDIVGATRAQQALKGFRLELQTTLKAEEALSKLDAFAVLATAERESNRAILRDIADRSAIGKKASEQDIEETKSAIANARLIAKNRRELKAMMTDIKTASAPGAFGKANADDAVDRFKAGSGAGAAGKIGLLKNLVFGGEKSSGILQVAQNAFEKIGDFSALPGAALRGQIDDLEKVAQARLGATGAEYSALSANITKTADSSGVATETLIDLDKQLLKSGFSVKELSDQTNDFTRIGADFIGTMGMSTDEVVKFLSAAKATGVGGAGFKRLANEATKLERSFGTLGLIEEFPELMADARKNAIALGKDFTGGTEKSAEAAAKLGLVIKTKIGGNIKDAVAAGRGITESFTDMADNIDDVLSGRAEEFSGKVNDMMEMMSRATHRSVSPVELRKMFDDPAKSIEVVGDDLIKLMSSVREGTPLWRRYRRGIDDTFGKPVTMMILQAARAGQSYNDVVAEGQKAGQDKKLKDEANAQAEVSRQLKESIEFRAKQIAVQKENAKAMALPREAIEAERAAMGLLTDQFTKLNDTLRELHADKGDSWFKSETAGWLALGGTVAGTLASLSQVSSIAKLLRAGGGLLGGGGSGAAATGATGEAAGLAPAGAGMGSAALTTVGVAALVNDLVAAGRGVVEFADVLHKGGMSVDNFVTASAAGFEKFRKSMLTNVTELVDKAFGTKLTDSIEEYTDPAGKAAADETRRQQADYAAGLTGDALRKARFGPAHEQRVAAQMAGFSSKFRTDPTARQGMLTDDVASWDAIREASGIPKTGLISPEQMKLTQSLNEMYQSGKVIPPQLMDKMKAQFEAQAKESEDREYMSLLRKVGNSSLAQKAVPIEDLRKMAVAADAAQTTPLDMPKPHDVLYNQNTTDALQAIGGTSDLNALIQGLNEHQQFSTDALTTGLKLIEEALKSMGDRLNPEVKIQLSADTELLRKALQAKEDSNQATRARPKRVG